MQNYGQQQTGYQRPGSTTGFGAPAVPPSYGVTQGYQTAAPQAQSQWAPPTSGQAPNQQWNQSQQVQGAYNPGVYGTMPGGYSQTQQAPNQAEIPPPPPPKPAGFAAAVQQQNAQSWGQQPTYNAQQQQQQQSYQTPQQNTGFTGQGQQGGYIQQGGYQGQGQGQAPAPQQYNTPAAPPPQSVAGSYHPQSQTPQNGGRPGSIYGAEQAGSYSTPSSAVTQQPPPVLGPSEQQPAYIPPSLTGQGVQSYVPSNTNPVPGVYVPPPPDMPAWQQASHAPLQGGSKFTYTKPMVDPRFQTPNYQPQAQYGQQPVQPTQQYGQAQFQPMGQQPQPQQASYTQPVSNQFPQAQQQPPLGQFTPQNNIPSTESTPYNQQQQGQPISSQPYQQQQSQWQPTPPVDNGYGQQQPPPQNTYSTPPHPPVQDPYGTQQQAWQQGHQVQAAPTEQQYPQGQDQVIQAPKPINGHTGSTPPGFVTQSSPHSVPVSPVHTRYSTSFGSGQTGLGRTGSVSSIALGAIHAQRAGNRTESPKPPPPKLPTPPPPRDDASKFSALGTGGPSDWEHFGGGDEVDDEELFGTKNELKNEKTAQQDSVELPAHVPSPVAQDWPTPPTQPAMLQRRDTYQPTPPPKTTGTPAQRPLSQPPQQNFVMGDIPPPQQPSAQPTSQSFIMGDAPPQQMQNTFVMGDVSPPSQPTPSGFSMDNAISSPDHHAMQEQQPHLAQQGYTIAGEGGISSLRGTPVQQTQHQPPQPSQQSFVMSDGQPQLTGGPTPSNLYHQGAGPGFTARDYESELKAKTNAIESLRTQTEKEKAEFRAEIEQLKVIVETTKNQAEYERNGLIEQIDSMKVTAEQARDRADALNKEKDSLIERLQEDAEGKDDAVKEKEITVEDLRRQLNVKDNELSDLKQQLETEKSKEVPQPRPADLVSDIDPWYASSLERFIVMLRNEAHEPLVDNKIKIFTDFLKAESGARGLGYHSAAPPVHQDQGSTQAAALSRGTSNASARKKDLNVQVPQTSSSDDIQYSPGGRPIVQRRPDLKSDDSVFPRQSFSVSSEPSAHSTAVLTPTSSQEDDFNKTPTPVQSPPEVQAAPQYKAYMPPSVSQIDSMNNVHRQSLPFASPTSTTATSFGSGKNDEIFFGSATPQNSSKPPSRPTTSASASSDIPVPAPLFSPQPLMSIASPGPKAKEDPIEKLVKLLPTTIGAPQPSPQLEALRKKMSKFTPDVSSFQDLTTAWEKSAALARKKNDDARRRRQEESEAHNNQLFDDHVISYAEIGELEDEFKEKERMLKAEEDRDEYRSYVENVFDQVYDGLQLQIKELMDLYIEAEGLLHTSISGVRALEGTNAATAGACLEALQGLFKLTETRHAKVIQAVAERDRRYKKTEIQPLYAAGNISKMKTVEKHFANAERQAAQRARSDKAARVNDLIRSAEQAIIAAVGTEQQDIDGIVSALHDLPDASDEKILARAQQTILALKDSSKSLLVLLNDLEIEVGGSVLEAQLAEAQVEKQTEKVSHLQKEIEERTKGFKEELDRKISVLEQNKEEIDTLLREKGGKVKLSEEDEKKARMNKALEQAKRRNGDL